jgi:hypothetical protein
VTSPRRRAISGPLTPVKRGLSRSLTDSPALRSNPITARKAQIPKLMVRISAGEAEWQSGVAADVDVLGPCSRGEDRRVAGDLLAGGGGLVVGVPDVPAHVVRDELKQVVSGTADGKLRNPQWVNQ